MNDNLSRRTARARVLLAAACLTLTCAASAAALQPQPIRTPPGRATATPAPPQANPTASPQTRPTQPTRQATPPPTTSFITPTPTPTPVWWTGVVINRPVGRDWLWFLGGVVFSSIVGYALYATMLRGQISANRHPANFRKLIFALVLLLSIIWFGYVFAYAFGGLMLGILLTVWAALALVFFFTKRPSGAAQ